jgi:hypothetical protein
MFPTVIIEKGVLPPAWRVRFYVKCGALEISYVAENSILNSTVLLNLLLRSLLKYTRRTQTNVACSTKRTDSAFLLSHKCSVLSTVPRYELQEFECWRVSLKISYSSILFLQYSNCMLTKLHNTESSFNIWKS